MNRAVGYMLLSALGFALMGTFVKIAGQKSIPLLEIVAARALVSLVLSYMDVKRKKLSLWGHRKGLLITRGAVGTFGLMCVYYSFTQLPIAEATVIQYLNPIFTMIIAIIFLKEVVRLSTILCITLSMIGLFLTLQPDTFFLAKSDFPFSVTAVAAGLTGAFLSGIAYTLVRKLNETEDSSVIIFYFPLIALPVALPLMDETWRMPQGWEWLILLMIGITTQIGQIGVTKAMQTEGAGRATSFAYTQILFAVIIGFVIFDEVPTLWTLSGALLIVFAAIINMLFGKNKLQ